MFSSTRKIRIQAEVLRQIARLRASLARRHAENFNLAGGRFHHSGEDLKGGGLARSIRPDQAKDFALVTSRQMPRTASSAPYRFTRSWIRIATDPGQSRARRSPAALRSPRASHRLNRPGGQVLPSTRISPSAGMPGLANPMPLFSCSFTPTTCFTRSSRK